MNEDSIAEQTEELYVVQVQPGDNSPPEPGEPDSDQITSRMQARSTRRVAAVARARNPFARSGGRSAFPEIADEMPDAAADNVAGNTTGDGKRMHRILKPGFRRGWRWRLLPDDLDRLREYPKFVLDSDDAGEAAQPGVFAAHAVTEADREPMFRLELLRMFRQRIQLGTIMAIALILLFTVMHVVLSPETQIETYKTHFYLLLVSLGIRMAARRVNNLLGARMLSLIAYALYSMGAAVILAQTGENSAGSGFENEFLSYGAYNPIMVSVLLLPFTVWECLVVATILIGSLSWSAWWSSLPGDAFYLPHIFLLSTTAFVILCIAHFQSILRRSAFDSAFDLARSAAQSETLSTLDVVTGGFNRHYLEKTLNAEIARAARFSRTLSVMMFDLDNFKSVNDTCGHTTGDEILREVSQIATKTVREVDTVARYGGDEFIAVLPETDDAAAYGIAERLQESTAERLRQRFAVEGPDCQVTLSIGLVTLNPSEIIPFEAVVEQIDERLYEAKRNGKNRIAT